MFVRRGCKIRIHSVMPRNFVPSPHNFYSLFSIGEPSHTRINTTVPRTNSFRPAWNCLNSPTTSQSHTRFAFRSAFDASIKATMAEELHDEGHRHRLMSRTASAMRFMDDDEIDAKIDLYANEDKSSTKTLTRIFVERYLENVRSSSCI